jgi:pyrimidine deaminase RibD-like protein
LNCAETDLQMMRRAIALAAARVGKTGSNPSVGCVVVSGGEIVSEAATAEGGRPHAEEHVLATAGERVRGATVYVTLEPCGERRNGAPSCSELVAAAGVARVVVACRDASPYAAGRGLERLRAAGIPVETGLLESEAKALYAAYKP